MGEHFFFAVQHSKEFYPQFGIRIFLLQLCIASLAQLPTYNQNHSPMTQFIRNFVAQQKRSRHVSKTLDIVPKRSTRTSDTYSFQKVSIVLNSLLLVLEGHNHRAKPFHTCALLNLNRKHTHILTKHISQISQNYDELFTETPSSRKVFVEKQIFRVKYPKLDNL